MTLTLAVNSRSPKPLAIKVSRMNMLLTHQAGLCKLTFCSSGRYVVFLVSFLKLVKPTNIQANEFTYPTIFKIAMDYLPVQASSVPCERVFSSSSETDTKKRNRLATDLMEGLQLRKYKLKKERLDFVKHWVTPVTDLTPDDEVEEVVQVHTDEL
jgi:hypothetical protein